MQVKSENSSIFILTYIGYYALKYSKFEISKLCLLFHLSSEIEAQIWRGTKYPNGIRHDNKFVHTDHSANPVLPTGAIINKEADYHPKKTTPVTPTNQTYLHLHASETDILE